ncbi:MAG: hypothetical protein KR126chlam4_00240 [Candidatus Anoxychlamydiales bacterium]|nr:hypothetical protein [Candidatus Anoxychlamydiales bacterium]HEU64208.1 hypothetical protein [Chlamydiota bacterium]
MRLFRKLLWALPIFALISIFLYGRKQEDSTSEKTSPPKDVETQLCDPCLEERQDACSDPCDPCATDPQTKAYDQGYGICENDLPKAYSAPGRIDVCGGIDAFVTGSFIYWEPLGDQLDLGTARFASLTPVELDLVKFKTNYEPGFKVGLGFNLNHDNWDLFAQYTRLHETETTRYTPRTRDSNDSIISSWFILDPLPAFFSDISGDIVAVWKTELDKIDLELARSYYLGAKLIARPFIGGSVHWLDQRYDLSLTESSVLQESSTKNDSWALGPRFGLGSSYLIYKGFRIFGYGAISLLFSENEISGVGNEDSAAYILNKVDKYILRDVEELMIGLGWGSYFTRKKWHMDLSVAYEAQRYARTNYMSYIAQLNLEANEVKAGDFYLHGLTVTARFDF